MKKGILLLLLLWACFGQAYAQNAENPAVTLYTGLATGSRVTLNVTAPTGSYKLDLGDENVIDVNSGMYQGKMTGSNIKIYGNITQLVPNNCLVDSIKINTNKLTLLNLASNSLAKLTLPESNELTSLSLERNKLTSITFPAELPAIETLNLKSNQLFVFPATKMPKLSVLIAGSNLFEKLELTGFVKLRSIRVSGCKLTTLSIPKMCVELHAEKNQLNFDENYFTNFSQLNSMRLSYNKVERINVTNCPALKEIEFRDNGIQSFTIDGNMPNLNYVDLRSGKLTADMLDAIYTALPSVTKGTIKVTGTLGAENAHGDIATSKGWKIDIAGIPGIPTGVVGNVAEEVWLSFDALSKQLHVANYFAVSSVRLYAVSGAVAASFVPASVINLSAFGSGVYFVEVLTKNNEKLALKIIL